MNNAVAYYQHRKASADQGLVGKRSRGVQAIVQDHPQCGRQIVSGHDYYIRHADGKWYGGDINALFIYLLDHCPDVAFGEMISTEEYNRVMTEVNLERPHGRPATERKA